MPSPTNPPGLLYNPTFLPNFGRTCNHQDTLHTFMQQNLYPIRIPYHPKRNISRCYHLGAPLSSKEPSRAKVASIFKKIESKKTQFPDELGKTAGLSLHPRKTQGLGRYSPNRALLGCQGRLRSLCLFRRIGAEEVHEVAGFV
jgi:hypothetical protein